MPIRFRILFLVQLALWLVHGARSAEAAQLPSEYQHLTVDSCSTSIYLGVVSLDLTPMTHRGGSFRCDYKARVIPLFMYNESGNIGVDFDSEQLERLQKGERVTFSGWARNQAGEERRITGHADPQGPRQGRIKVRVWVTNKIQLIFNTQYRFN